MKAIQVSKLRANPNNIRKKFDPEFLERLAKSIDKFGVLTPILALQDGTIIAGEQRWRAAKKAGRKTLKVGSEVLLLEGDIVKSSKGRKQDLDVINAIENMMRRNLTVFEEAEGLMRLIREYSDIKEPREAIKHLRAVYVALPGREPSKEQRDILAIVDSLGLTVNRAMNLLSLFGLTDDARQHVEKALGTGWNRFNLEKLKQLSRVPAPHQLTMAHFVTNKGAGATSIMRFFKEWQKGMRNEKFERIPQKAEGMESVMAMMKRRELALKKLRRQEADDFAWPAFVVDLKMLKRDAARGGDYTAAADRQMRESATHWIDECVKELLRLQKGLRRAAQQAAAAKKPAAAKKKAAKAA